MTGQIGVMLVERFQLLYREEALECQSRVDSRTCMTLGAYKPVAAFPLGILRIIFHFRTVQNSQNFYDRHRTAQMAETAGDKLFHRLDADLLGKLIEFLDLFCTIHKYSSYGWMRWNYSTSIDCSTASRRL